MNIALITTPSEATPSPFPLSAPEGAQGWMEVFKTTALDKAPHDQECLPPSSCMEKPHDHLEDCEAPEENSPSSQTTQAAVWVIPSFIKEPLSFSPEDATSRPSPDSLHHAESSGEGGLNAILLPNLEGEIHQTPPTHAQPTLNPEAWAKVMTSQDKGISETPSSMVVRGTETQDMPSDVTLHHTLITEENPLVASEIASTSDFSSSESSSQESPDQGGMGISHAERSTLALTGEETRESFALTLAQSEDVALSGLTSSESEAAQTLWAQTIRQLQPYKEPGTHRFVIQLKPTRLGSIQVELDIKPDQNIKLHMRVENPETLNLLRQHTSAVQKLFEDAQWIAPRHNLSFELAPQDHPQQEGRFQSHTGFHHEPPEDTLDDIAQSMTSTASRLTALHRYNVWA